MTHSTPAGEVAEDVMKRFFDAWNRRDLSAAMALTSQSFSFEAFAPAPSGQRGIGRAEVEATWKPRFDDPTSRLTIEDSFTAGESFTAGTRVVQHWRYDFAGGCARGVDIATVRDGLITEIVTYVKGGPEPA
jgi:ketosteroid isomerase-like protein